MPESNANEDSPREAAPAVTRRALIVTDEDDGVDALRENLTSAGFETARAFVPEAALLVEELSPSIVLIIFGEHEGNGRLVTLARRLRSGAATCALPLVFLFRDDERTLRSAALRVGADDYFAQGVPREELRARLDALLWRVEAGRRAVPTVAEQRDEIDNFIFLLEAVTTDAREGRTGALALIEARRGSDDSRATGDRSALAEAHGFLKLNLRRVDAVAFYGPATLLAYLPGADSEAASSTLNALREEFSEIRPASDISIGISSFPAHGAEVEWLVEQAESALDKARAENSNARVFVYDSGGASHPASLADTGRRASGVMNARVAAKSQAGDGRGASTEHLAFAAHANERRAGGKLRRVMLVVSEAARMAQINLLIRSASYEVRAAFDGQHALNLLRIDRPDLLVVDYELQGMDGVEMLKCLAKQLGAGTPPTLMLLPAGREDLRRAASQAGAGGFVNMPYDAVELLDTLGGLVEED